MPSSSVFAPPIRRTKTSPYTSTLKLRLVIPPPSSDTVAERPGHSRSTAARAPSTWPGSYLLEWPRDGLAVHGSRARRTALKVHPARDHQRPPHHRRQGEGLAERLCEVAPIGGAKKAVFFSTGAEAIENAVKIARSATGRPGVISFRGGFHGRTLLALSLTGSVQPYKQDFGPYAAEIYQTPFPYPYRGWTTEAALADLNNLLASEAGRARGARIVIEPVPREGRLCAAA